MLGYQFYGDPYTKQEEDGFGGAQKRAKKHLLYIALCKKG
jgi:hypothetical protein